MTGFIKVNQGREGSRERELCTGEWVGEGKNLALKAEGGCLVGGAASIHSVFTLLSRYCLCGTQPRQLTCPSNQQPGM